MDRDDFGGAGAARGGSAGGAGAIAKCATYEEDVTAKMAAMFDQLGGLEKLVRNKTVTIKVNMTGPPGLRFQGMALA